MENVVITIGREYGSGGRYIGKEVAKRLNINFYDKELLQKTYEKNQCNYTKLEQYDETKRNSILKAMDLLNSNNYEAAFEDDRCQILISKTILDLAQNESCVILGRNANNLLKDKKNVINIFIYSNDLDFKIKRKMETEKLSYQETFNKLKQVDKKRKKYYEYVNKNHIWGDKKDYDFCLDSSVLGIDGTIDLIVDIYKKKEGIKNGKQTI